MISESHPFSSTVYGADVYVLETVGEYSMCEIEAGTQPVRILKLADWVGSGFPDAIVYLTASTKLETTTKTFTTGEMARLGGKPGTATATLRAGRTATDPGAANSYRLTNAEGRYAPDMPFWIGPGEFFSIVLRNANTQLRTQMLWQEGV